MSHTELRAIRMLAHIIRELPPRQREFWEAQVYRMLMGDPIHAGELCL